MKPAWSLENEINQNKTQQTTVVKGYTYLKKTHSQKRSYPERCLNENKNLCVCVYKSEITNKKTHKQILMNTRLNCIHKQRVVKCSKNRPNKQ